MNDAPAPQSTSRPRGRDRAGVALPAVAAALTVLFTIGIAARPLGATVLLALLAASAAVVFAWRRIAGSSLGTVLVALVLLLPLAALLGPSLAAPVAPQLFAFRVLLALVVFIAIVWLLVRRTAERWPAWDLALPLAVWFGWLVLALLWAPDTAAASSPSAGPWSSPTRSSWASARSKPSPASVCRPPSSPPR